MFIMDKKNLVLLVFTVLISVSLCGAGLYNKWFSSAAIFSYNILKSWLNENDAQISRDENTTTVKKSEFAYYLLSDITIPENITVIENSAFKGNKLTGVIIPPSVTSIGEKAFAANRLTSITIGSNVSLKDNAFGYGFEDAYKNNDMDAGTYKRAYAKSTEWSLWYDNFEYRKNDGNISIIGYDGHEEDLVIPEEINGYPVKIIGKRAFSEKNFKSVIISNSVTDIEEMAFFGRWNEAQKKPLGAIASVTFGKNVAAIGERAFENNSISRIVIPNSVKSIGYSAFADNPITSVSIGANVKLGSKDSATGILGEGTGFNTAYGNNNNRAGVYTRPNVKSGTWTRTVQTSAAAQTGRF